MKIKLISFSRVFNLPKSKPLTKSQAIKLANKVHKALIKEEQTL